MQTSAGILINAAAAMFLPPLFIYLFMTLLTRTSITWQFPYSTVSVTAAQTFANAMHWISAWLLTVEAEWRQRFRTLVAAGSRSSASFHRFPTVTHELIASSMRDRKMSCSILSVTYIYVRLSIRHQIVRRKASANQNGVYFQLNWKLRKARSHLSGKWKSEAEQLNCLQGILTWIISRYADWPTAHNLSNYNHCANFCQQCIGQSNFSLKPMWKCFIT